MFEVFRFIAENAHGQTEVELQMKCRYCLGTESRVVDSRPTEDGTAIRRRRECSNCGKRFTTYEKIEDIPISVVKRDGTREAFNSEKILAGVRKACEKRSGAKHTRGRCYERDFQHPGAGGHNHTHRRNGNEKT